MFNTNPAFLYYVDTDIFNIYFRKESDYESYDYSFKDNKKISDYTTYKADEDRGTVKT